MKIRPEHHLMGLLKDLKAQVVRINSLDRVTLGVGVKLWHLKHFFPVLQKLAQWDCYYKRLIDQTSKIGRVICCTKQLTVDVILVCGSVVLFAWELCGNLYCASLCAILERKWPDLAILDTTGWNVGDLSLVIYCWCWHRVMLLIKQVAKVNKYSTWCNMNL